MVSISLSDVLGIILAVVLGGAVGLEREFRGKTAGLRTNILICVGAAAFTIISRQMAFMYGASAARISAQVVTGVGFLGAGAIIQDRGGIHGLTTAATIWLVASIGMACGMHLYRLAVLITVIAVVILIIQTLFSKPIERVRQRTQRPLPFEGKVDKKED